MMARGAVRCWIHLERCEVGTGFILLFFFPFLFYPLCVLGVGQGGSILYHHFGYVRNHLAPALRGSEWGVATSMGGGTQVGAKYAFFSILTTHTRIRHIILV